MTIVTWDAVNKGTSVVLSNNNLTATIPSNINTARASVGRTSGKWYWEIAFVSLSYAMIGIVRENTNLNAVSYSTTGNAFYYNMNGNKYPSASVYGQSYALSDVISVLLDMDLGTIEFWKNGIPQGVMFNDLKNNTSPVYPAITSGSGSTGSTSTARFNINEFTYQPPEGYLAYDGSKKTVSKILLLPSDGKARGIIKGKLSNADAIPKMTSATAPSGRVTQSSYHTSYQPYGAFDDSDTGNGWLTVGGITYGWLAYELPSSKIIGGYSLISSVVVRAPKDWTFEGSNDGLNWVVLDARANVNDWVNTQKKYFYFDNNKEYKHYRINVTNNNGDTSYLSITEMEMFEKLEKDSCNQIPSHSVSNIINYGMSSPIKTDGIYTTKNYILQDTVSENAEGLWTTQINRKPLSIKFN